MLKAVQSVSCHLLMVCFFCLCSTQIALADVRKDASFNIRVVHDSNVNLTDPERGNTGYVIGGEGGLTQTSARFNSQLRVRLEREFNSNLSDETRPSGYLSSRMTMVRRYLFWTLNDSFSQTRVNPLRAGIFDNVTNTNTLSTGPDLIIPISPFTQFRLNARHQRTDYGSSVRSDRTRDNASAFLNHAISPRWSVSVSQARSWEDFSIAERELITDKVSLNHNGTRVSWSVAGGQSSVADGLLESDVRDATFRFRLTEQSALYANYSLSIDSDIGSSLSLASDRLNDIQFLASDCARELGSEGGPCRRLPGVSVLPGDDLLWRYQREGLPYYMTESGLLQTYLSEFGFDSALFESEVYNVGFQSQLKRVNFQVNLRQDEQRRTFDAISGSPLTSPEILTTQTVNLTVGFPLTGRLRGSLGYAIRKPELENLVGITRSEEHRSSAQLTWVVEPRLYSYLSLNHSEFENDGSDKRDNQNIALGFRYRLQ